MATRLADSFETALELADGIAIAEFADKPLTSPPPPGEGGEGRTKRVETAPPLAPPEEASAAAGADADGILHNKNETHERITFSARFACPVSGFTIEEIEPRLFSFNAPAGACPKCDGLGTEMRFEADLVVPDHTLSLKQGAVYPWAKTGSTSPYYEQTLEALAKHFKVSMATPWEQAAQEGAGRHPVRHRRGGGGRSSTRTACASTRTPSRSRA